jgi:peptide/nickel transport system permease protein
MATRREKFAFNIKRFTSFLRAMFSEPRGVLGVAIIIFFIILAVFAPVIAKYDPYYDEFVAGDYAAPSWVRLIPGSEHYSENMLIVDDPNFDSAASVREWNITKTSDGLDVMYSTVQGGPSSGQGCLAIVYKREAGESPGTVELVFRKQFEYPYVDSPKRFSANFSLLPAKLEGLNVLRVMVGFDRIVKEGLFQIQFNADGGLIETGTTYKLISGILPKPCTTWEILDQVSGEPTGVEFHVGWNDGEENFQIDAIKPHAVTVNASQPVTAELRLETYTLYTKTFSSSSGVWLVSSDVDSRSGDVFSMFGGVDDPAKVLFNTSISKTYGLYLKLEFIDTDKAKNVDCLVYLDGFGLKLLGNAFGLLGTDQRGRDIFSQLVYGTRISLEVGLLSAALSVVIGLVVGVVAGYVGSFVDELLMRFTDMLLVLPSLPLLLVLIAVLGPSMWNLILLIGVLGWMGFARVVRSQVLSLKERPFIESAKAIGAGRSYIIFKHIVPNVVSLVYVTLALSVPSAILSEAALSWLGLFDPWVMSWGRMLHDAMAFERSVEKWWWILPPGLCIAVLSLSFILIGYAIDDILNPKLRQRR